MSDFSNRLRAMREDAGMTQQQLADAAGVKVGAIRDLEQERNGPTWDTVQALAEALGVSCEDFRQTPTTEPPSAPRKPGRPRKPDATPTETPPAQEATPAVEEPKKPSKKKGKQG